MMKAQHNAARDYSGLFVGTILTGLVVIVFVLMLAIAQSRARSAPLRSNAAVHGENSVLTSKIYFQPGGTN
jgi:hypothetical protein